MQGAPFSITSLLGGGTRGSGGLTRLLRSLKLDRLDSGDVLLLLIVLLLLWEGDDLELVIALGLALIMGLGDEEGTEIE
jgi:prepilin signal peptidase PulO-like enzyme (type II secretory pathway)